MFAPILVDKHPVSQRLTGIVPKSTVKCSSKRILLDVALKSIIEVALHPSLVRFIPFIEFLTTEDVMHKDLMDMDFDAMDFMEPHSATLTQPREK